MAILKKPGKRPSRRTRIRQDKQTALALVRHRHKAQRRLKMLRRSPAWNRAEKLADYNRAMKTGVWDSKLKREYGVRGLTCHEHRRPWDSIWVAWQYYKWLEDWAVEGHNQEHWQVVRWACRLSACYAIKLGLEFVLLVMLSEDISPETVKVLFSCLNWTMYPLWPVGILAALCGAWYQDYLDWSLFRTPIRRRLDWAELYKCAEGWAATTVFIWLVLIILNINYFLGPAVAVEELKALSVHPGGHSLRISLMIISPKFTVVWAPMLVNISLVCHLCKAICRPACSYMRHRLVYYRHLE